MNLLSNFNLNYTHGIKDGVEIMNIHIYIHNNVVPMLNEKNIGGKKTVHAWHRSNAMN